MAAKVTERAVNSTAPAAEVPPEVPPVMASTSRAPLGPHLAIRSELVKLRTYHELVALVPSIGETFYKTAYTGKERAEVYQKFYKNTDMNYKPPKISEAASQSAKKSETNLYNIQAGLAQITRPLDTMAHSIISKGEITDDEPNSCVHQHNKKSARRPGLADHADAYR
ncbi:hypothetical protein AX774_g7761 [Zancudomyces culisetae]|uniref:Uncharacterized protein n=1 Tax=Zancudomyces culisetae TaxID=1213189 RepID=A0A1R1PD37_ZANCU|nr:hypothetical protein AX774_g7761 [Zancudomyces culisetae]|eukprot:OMH78841.1 hypothetical protein AX774_g7761 [Zancudomyces culisetae]